MCWSGDGELGFDPGEGVWKMVTTSKESSRLANDSIRIQEGSDNEL